MKPATSALVALTALNLLNYLDRFVVAGMVAPLKEAFGATDAQIGLLTSVFLVAYMVASPLFGVLARSTRRTALLGAGVLVWSAATVMAGFASGLGQLTASRAIIGVGEAAYATVGPTILGDWFPPQKRSTVLAIFYSAIPVGSALGFLIGGLVSESVGWRAAFWVAGVPGLVLGLLCFRLTEPVPGSMDAAPSRVPLWKLATNTTWMWCVAGYTAYTFSLGALAVWMSAFLQRERGWSMESASVTFGLVVVTTGLIGTMAGGAIDAKVSKGRAAQSLALCGLASLGAAPLLLVAILAEGHTTAIVAMALGCLLAFVAQAPVNAAILNSVDSGARAFAVGMSTLVIHLLGDVPSPWLVGEVSDATGSLASGLAVVPIGFLVGAILWGIGALRLWRRA